MKSKLQSLLGTLLSLAIVAVIIVGYNWLEKRNDKRYFEQKAEARMQKHNHLHLENLLALQRLDLAQIQDRIGVNHSFEEKNKWVGGDTSTTKSGYTYAAWDCYSPKTEGDRYGFTSDLKCIDIAERTLVQYSTNDVAYLPSLVSDIQRIDDFKQDEYARDKGTDIIYRSFRNDKSQVGVMTFSSEQQKGEPLHYMIIVASLDDYKLLVSRQLDIE